MRPLTVALTGGVASGKSTVARLIAARGVPVVDADRIARELVAPGTEGLAAVVAAFGPQFLAADGQLDRAALRQLVFADPARRRELEALLHPRIHARMRARVEGAKAPWVLVDIPLLAEGGRPDWIDRVLVVDLPVELQRQRLLERDGIDAALADAMIAAQASRAERLALADEVLDNSAGLEALDQAVAALCQRYDALAQARRAD